MTRWHEVKGKLYDLDLIQVYEEYVDPGAELPRSIEQGLTVEEHLESLPSLQDFWQQAEDDSDHRYADSRLVPYLEDRDLWDEDSYTNVYLYYVACAATVEIA